MEKNEKVIEYYEGRFCVCGCGGKIKVYPHHKYTGIPTYVNHHGMQGKSQSEYQKKTTGDKNSARYLGKSVTDRGHKSDCTCTICRVKRGDFTHIDSVKRIKAVYEAIKRKMLRDGKHWHKGRTGKDSFNWHGGISKIGYKNFTNTLKLKVRVRDNFCCRNCGLSEEDHYRGGKLVSLIVHHIDYNKGNCLETNLITVCNTCNLKANFNRDYWYSLYIYIMENEICITY